MRWPLPKSLNGFLLLGLSVLAGPLLLAILNATVQMRHLADSSQRLVADGVQTTRLSQDLYAQIALLERSAKLYQVLGDDSVLVAFRDHDQRLSSIVLALIFIEFLAKRAKLPTARSCRPVRGIHFEA